MLAVQRKVKTHPYFHLAPREAEDTSWEIPALCQAYNWPKNLPGGSVIAIYEAAGGWLQSDIDLFCARFGMPSFTPVDMSVDGTNNSHCNPQNDADYEVALDIMAVAASYWYATGKVPSIWMIWGQDIASSVLYAAKNSAAVMSCSWGDDEAAWGPTNCNEMETAIQTGIASGMTFLAAAGDNDSSDGGPGAANVDCPASCPSAVACCGTSKPGTGPEVVWNNDPGHTNGEGTGGGFSISFSVQAWQVGAPTPVEARMKGAKASGGAGRMVGDLAACADPNTGVQICVYGQWQVIGGTSFVAPFMAGLLAGTGKRLGFVNPLIWGNKSVFVDITSGNNGEYQALVGPDPVSGLGAPDGAALAALLMR